MRLETLTIEEFNCYLKSSNFHPTAEYESKTRKKVLSKIMTSMINLEIKQKLSHPSVTIDILPNNHTVVLESRLDESKDRNLALENISADSDNKEFEKINVKVPDKINLINSDFCFDKAA